MAHELTEHLLHPCIRRKTRITQNDPALLRSSCNCVAKKIQAERICPAGRTGVGADMTLQLARCRLLCWCVSKLPRTKTLCLGNIVCRESDSANHSVVRRCLNPRSESRQRQEGQWGVDLNRCRLLCPSQHPDQRSLTIEVDKGAERVGQARDPLEVYQFIIMSPNLIYIQ